MIPSASIPLTRRLLASFSQWRNASLSSRARMPLAAGERSALEALDRNFHLAGAPERWIVDGRLDHGKLAVLLAGFTLTEEAVPDLVRASRLSGFQASILQRELTRWLKDGNFRAVTTVLNRPESLGNQTAPAEREAQQAPAAGVVVALHSVPAERPLSPPAGTKPAEVIDRSSTVIPPVLATQNASGLPANQTHTDPFEPEGSLTQETTTMAVVSGIEAVSNPVRDYVETMEQRQSFSEGRIGDMRPERIDGSIQQRVEAWVGRLDIDLTQVIERELVQEIAGQLQIPEKSVHDAIRRLRAARGIRIHEQKQAGGVIAQMSTKDRVRELVERWEWDLGKPFPIGGVKKISEVLQVNRNSVASALRIIRDETGQRATPNNAGRRDGSVAQRVQEALRANGWDLRNLPESYSSILSQQIGMPANQVRNAVGSLRRDRSITPTSNPPASTRTAPAAERPAAAAALNTVENPPASPAQAPAPPAVLVADDVRSLGLKLAGKLADLDDREALLKAVSIWEQVK